MKEFLLKTFGWIPIPKFTLRILPKKYRKRIADNFLEIIEEENLMPKFVQMLLEKAEEKYDPKEGKKYGTTKEEVDKAMSDFPILKPYEIYFTRLCERKRKEYKLPL